MNWYKIAMDAGVIEKVAQGNSAPGVGTNWYEKSTGSFEYGDKVNVTLIKEDTLIDRSGTIGIRYYIDEDNENYWLSEYPPRFGQGRDRSLTYSKYYYQIERA